MVGCLRLRAYQQAQQRKDSEGRRSSQAFFTLWIQGALRLGIADDFTQDGSVSLSILHLFLNLVNGGIRTGDFISLEAKMYTACANLITGF
jgi:hypothetical protein